MANTSVKPKVRQYLLEHPEAKNTDVMLALGVSQRTVSTVRAELRDEGGVPAAGDKRHASPRVDPAAAVTGAAAGAFDVQTTSDLNRAVGASIGDGDFNEDGTIDILKLKRALWRIVRTNRDDRIVVAAAGTLARIQQEANSRPLGPGKPLTRDDAVARLIALFKAVGINVVLEAINRWTGAGNATGTSKAADAQVAEQAPARPAGATDNVPAPGAAA